MECPFCDKRAHVRTRHKRAGKRYGKLPGLVRTYECTACHASFKTLEIPLDKADLLARKFSLLYPGVDSFYRK